MVCDLMGHMPSACHIGVAMAAPAHMGTACIPVKPCRCKRTGQSCPGVSWHPTDSMLIPAPSQPMPASPAHPARCPPTRTQLHHLAVSWACSWSPGSASSPGRHTALVTMTARRVAQGPWRNHHAQPTELPTAQTHRLFPFQGWRQGRAGRLFCQRGHSEKLASGAGARTVPGLLPGSRGGALNSNSVLSAVPKPWGWGQAQETPSTPLCSGPSALLKAQHYRDLSPRRKRPR